MAQRGLKQTALFICDIQERFRGAIHEYPAVIKSESPFPVLPYFSVRTRIGELTCRTANKMLKASKILNMPVYCTTQNVPPFLP